MSERNVHPMLRAASPTRRTDTGRQRRGNEDSSFARPPLFVVADGMGGAQAGEVASRLAVEAFAQGLPEQGSPEERLAVRVREANQRIHELSRSEEEHAGMGTTLTAALLEDDGVAIAHVGDSRAYLFRDGELTRLTRDHSLVGELVEQGKLTEEQAEEHPQRSIITRALGPEPDVKVDTWTYPVRAGDVLLLCSDGLTSMVGDDRITALLAAADSDLPRAAERLIDEANAAGGRDNITVVLFRLEEAGSSGDGDQPTKIVAPGGALAATPASLDRPAPPPPPPAPAPAPSSRASRSARRLARAAPASRTDAAALPPRGTRRNPRWAKPIAAALASLIVLSLVLAGGYLATRQLYFVGTDSQGIVSIYRGLPYELPAGIHLYESFYVSGVAASEIPSARRTTVLDHRLRSQRDASGLVRALELGRLTK